MTNIYKFITRIYFFEWIFKEKVLNIALIVTPLLPLIIYLVIISSIPCYYIINSDRINACFLLLSQPICHAL